MEQGHRLCITFIALNVHLFVSVFLGHRRHGNVRIELLNHELLVLIAEHGLFAKRACSLASLQERAHTVGVHRMAAAQKLDGISGRMEGLQADRTVIPRRIG